MSKNNIRSKNIDNSAIKVLKVILAVLTIIYPLMMNLLSGFGMFIEWNNSDFVLNCNKYSKELTFFGILMILGGLTMTAASVLCILKKYKSAIILSPTGLALSLISLFYVSHHADFAGWSDKYTMQPISNMYIERNLPVIIPFLICVILSAFKLFSQKNN